MSDLVINLDNMLEYPSIENSCYKKGIEGWLKYHPELKNEKFGVTEKIHGANFCILLTPYKLPRYFSRNQEIIGKNNFHGYKIAMSEPILENAIAEIQSEVDETDVEIRLFGELFGAGIMKGVNYGLQKDKKFRVFDAIYGSNWVTQEGLFGSTGALQDILVPNLGVFSFQEALDFNAEQLTTLHNKEDNLWEGIVIKPWSRIYRSPDGSMFYLKKKSEKFSEKQKAKAPRAVDDEVTRVNLVFAEYFNDNRIQSCFSKMGEIQSPNQIGDYLKIIMEDAKLDFLKDHEELFQTLSKDQQKKALSMGSVVADLLKPYL